MDISIAQLPLYCTLTIPDDFLSFSRKKKNPQLAHRSHEFFDASLAPPFPTRSSQRQLLGDETDSRVRERNSPWSRRKCVHIKSDLLSAIYVHVPEAPGSEKVLKGSSCVERKTCYISTFSKTHKHFGVLLVSSLLRF